MRRSRLLATAIAAVAACLAVAPAAMAKSPTILWSTTAPTAQIAKAGENYTVTLPMTSPTAWFTDRPARSAGSTDILGFVGGWQQNHFDRTPPNAAIVLHHDGQTMQSVIVLSKPKELPRQHKIRFNARILPSGKVMDMATMNETLPTGTFRDIELFIDAGDAPACGAMITQPGWCTLVSSDSNAASTTVDLQTPNKAGHTRTVQACFWTGDHQLDAQINWQEQYIQQNPYSDNKSLANCNNPSFSNLAAATWTFSPVNHYFLSGAVSWTRNLSATFTLHSAKQSYGTFWWSYSTPKIVIVVSDS
ncbi:MAG: hypothetical protein ACR2J9_10760 [Gaiellales bacterium]